ncbi:MAG TPA: cytochrome c3 family protein [Acidobacteriaceae bacterium]|nr:cytochrome c3 family protein [Acidobacteriaceae bacterium]
MPQIFDRSSNALARMTLILTGLIVIALGLTLDALQRSPWVTRQGQRADQPVPFSHKHHVEGLGLQCQYCHTTVEKSSYAGIPPTKTCMNCHAQIWTDAQLLEPVRESWATGQSLPWMRVHDLPDYVFFNHEIHVNKGIGCSSCHGRVDEMPIMYMQNSLQMEWCLNCHRDPEKNLRPTSEIYNMAWKPASELNPVWCAAQDVGKGTPTAEGVTCTTRAPGGGEEMASLDPPLKGVNAQVPGTQIGSENPTPTQLPAGLHYTRFTDQQALGNFLADHYKIRNPRELTSCEVCHR